MSDNHSISSSKKPLKSLKIINVPQGETKDRIHSDIGEGLFFLLFGYKLHNTKDKKGNPINFQATGAFNKMDFYYSYDGKHDIGVDYELVGDILFKSKGDSKKKQAVIEKLMSGSKLKESALYVKYGYPKLVARKFVSVENHKKIIDILMDSFQADNFRKEMFKWDAKTFEPLYTKIPNDTYGSYRKSYSSYVNISDFVRTGEKESRKDFEKKLKSDLTEMYSVKKDSYGYKNFYLFQNVINHKSSEEFYKVIHEEGIVNELSDFLEYFWNSRSGLNNSTDRKSWKDIMDGYPKKDAILDKVFLGKLNKGYKIFDSIIVDMDSAIKNIAKMDFTYEKTDDEKKDYTGETASYLDKSKEFSYRTFLFPQTEAIMEKITVSKLPTE